MVFSSLTFIFVFLPVVIILYYIVPKSLRNYILLVFSLFFYGYSEPKFTAIMLLSIFINYGFGLAVDKYRDEESKVKLLLSATVFSNLLILGYFKYTNFVFDNINSIFKLNIGIEKIIMPIGISFFTFQAMSYVIDVYRKQGEVQKNPLNVALYITFFPQLIAGPIVRYETVAEQIKERSHNLPNFVTGIERFIIGLGKKVLIANTMGLIADEIFSLQFGSISTVTSWVGAIAYSLQIYFDFSGYSDMAIGLGKMFGFEFLENFNYPYISKSATEFWRRWHISLGTWFRDYLYIPLGGNRVSNLKIYRNLFIVWFLTGLWHGASWTFIFWGLYFGILISLEKMGLGKILKKLWLPIQYVYALAAVILGWVLFRAQSLTFALQYIKVMFGCGSYGLYDNSLLYYVHDFGLELIVALAACTPIAKVISSVVNSLKLKALKAATNSFIWPLYLFSIFILCIMNLVNSTFNPFIYFRF